MIIVSAQPHSAAIDAIEKRLTEMGKESRMNDVVKKAIDETAAKGKKELWKGVKKRYTLEDFSAGDVRKRGYSARSPAAVLTVTGPALGILKHYKTIPNDIDNAARLQVFKADTMKTLTIHNNGSVYKAFLAKMKSGHEGIFQRVPGKKMEKDPKKQAIKEILSLSKSKAAEMVYEKNGVYAVIQEEMVLRLHKHMNAVIGGAE